MTPGGVGSSSIPPSPTANSVGAKVLTSIARTTAYQQPAFFHQCAAGFLHSPQTQEEYSEYLYIIISLVATAKLDNPIKAKAAAQEAARICASRWKLPYPDKKIYDHHLELYNHVHVRYYQMKLDWCCSVLPVKKITSHLEIFVDH